MGRIKKGGGWDMRFKGSKGSSRPLTAIEGKVILILGWVFMLGLVGFLISVGSFGSNIFLFIFIVGSFVIGMMSKR